MNANEQTKEAEMAVKSEVAIVETSAQKNILIDNIDGLQKLFDSGDLEKINDMEKSPLNLSVQYAEFQLNVPRRFAYMGITESVTESGEIMPSVVLIDQNKDTYLNHGTILVDTFIKNNIPVCQYVEITWSGNKKTAKGNQVRMWRVNLINKVNK
jgi:hypothetical protein